MALRESEARWKFALEGAGDGVWDWCPFSGSYFVSQRWRDIVGLQETDLASPFEEWKKRIHPDDRLWIESSLDSSARGGVNAFDNEYRLQRTDGSYIWVQGRGKVISSTKDGLPLRIIGTLSDITARKEMERSVRASQEQLQSYLNRTSIEVSIAEERQRCRIAGELHDQVGPNLLLVKMRLEALKSEFPSGENEAVFASIEELMEKTIQDIISLTFQLRPPILANAGLEAALKWLAQEFIQIYDLQVMVQDDMASNPLKFEARSIIFQAVRELLLNVSKHAKTSIAWINIKREADTVIVTVKDDGIGFQVDDSTEAIMKNKGFGIFNIRNKIEYLGGGLTIDSSPGGGTRVSITVPLEQKA
jgi:PAS domain S-box-containing protein